MLKQKVAKGNFFILDADRAVAIAKRSMNEGLAFVIMAAGSAADNVQTKWSTTSVAKYAGLGIPRAKAAIDSLMAAGDIERAVQSSVAAPVYTLAPLGARIAYLPKSIVLGTGTSMPLIKRLRETGDNLALAFFLELNALQNLAGDLGLPQTICHIRYERREIGEVDNYRAWAFGGEPEFEAPEMPATFSAYFAGGEVEFPFSRLQTLMNVGAVEWSPYLWESDALDSEPITPCVTTIPDCNHPYYELWGAAFLTTDKILGEEAEERLDEALADDLAFAVPLHGHKGAVQVRSILRLTHRPKTKNAAHFAASTRTLANRFVKRMNYLREKVSENTAEK